MQPTLLPALALFALAFIPSGCASDEAPTTPGFTGNDCGCGVSVCGYDLCGNSCGTCGAEGMALCSAGQCVDSTTCSSDLLGFDTTAEAAYNRTSGGKTKLYYVASTGKGDPPFEKLVVELDHEKFFDGATPAPGVYDLSAEDPNDCGLCVRGYSYCNEDDCFNKYVVDEGEIELVATGEPGTPFTGRFTGLKLREVLRDTSNGKWKEHPNPKTFCMGDFHFDADVPELKQAEGNCLAEGTGDQIGDNVKDFTLTNCLGEEINLHDMCGSSLVWIVATAGWCGACTTFVPVVGEEYENRRDDGLEIMIVIGETSTGGPPNLEYCYDYATSKGVDPTKVFIDNDEKSWGVTFDAVSTYGSGIGLPWSALLDGRSMEYMWNSSVGEGSVLENVNSLLP